MSRSGLSIEQPKIFGVSESSVTLVFGVYEGDRAVDAEAAVRLDGEVRAVSKGSAGTRLVRIEGLEPDRDYEVEIDVVGGRGAEPNRYFPGRARTLPAARSKQVASFATLNDLHFGEPRMGGVLTDDHEYGDAAPGFPVVADDDYERPYAEFMNTDAIEEINRLDVDLTVIKGDIADRGLPEQFELAARTFEAFEKPHHAFLGNHDYLERNQGREVDGYGLLGQEPAPRSVDLAGFRLLLLDTTIPGRHEGAFGRERREWLADALAERRDTPTLLFTHHHPVPPEHSGGYPNTIGIAPADSVALFELLEHAPQVKGVLIGHTHRNRIRRYPRTGTLPFAEVVNPKDYPGGFGHYRLFEDGSFRQEVLRISSRRALRHSTRCRELFRGMYQHFTLGSLGERCYVAGD
jgi:predicted MPP superfamily phosphohydrolase